MVKQHHKFSKKIGKLYTIKLEISPITRERTLVVIQLKDNYNYWRTRYSTPMEALLIYNGIKRIRDIKYLTE